MLTKKISINKNIEIRSKDAKATITANFDRENANIFEISENAILRFNNVNINGNDKSKFPAKYAITSSKENAFGYQLVINNCDIYGFNVETGSIFKANKGSFADSIIITNSNLSNSFKGLSLGDEKDDKGLYNAEYIKLYNSTFSNIKQYVIDYYRGGTDESTLGGSLEIDHCVFDYCANDEKQTMLKTSGIVNVNIMNSIFNNSLAKTLVKLSGSKNGISFCAVNNCEDPKVVAGARSYNIIIANPKFEKKSFKLSKKSKLLRKASDGANIGLK